MNDAVAPSDSTPTPSTAPARRPRAPRPPPIAVTAAAVERVRELLTKRGKPAAGVRIGVRTRGCSGLSYTFAWEKEARMGDEVFEGPDGARIYVDKKSLLFLNGTVLEYDTSLVSKGFVFNNPNAKSTCGCGSSFGA